MEVTDGLWELVPVVVAAGKGYDQRSPAEVADDSPAGRALAEGDRSRLRDLADGFTQAMDAAAGVPEEDAWNSVTVTQMMSDPFGTLRGLIDMPAYGARVVADPRFTRLAAGLSGASAAESSYLVAYLRATVRSERTPMLLRALFVAAVGSVEPLVTRFVTLLLFDAEPGAYRSLADPALEKKARSLCGGGPASWRKALAETLGVSTAAGALDWQRLEHLWEQRNVIVHRGGVGDARYSSKTGGEVGDVPAADPAEVQAAVDEIGAARFGLAAVVWHHLMPDLGEMISGGIYLLFCESLEAGRWRQAAGLATVDAAIAADAEAAADAQVSKWLALDMGRGLRPSKLRSRHGTSPACPIGTGWRNRCCSATTITPSLCCVTSLPTGPSPLTRSRAGRCSNAYAMKTSSRTSCRPTQVRDTAWRDHLGVNEKVSAHHLGL